MIDQTKLPNSLEYVTYTDYNDVAAAIRNLVIRGAPAIGVAGAFGLALAAFEMAEEACVGVTLETENTAELFGEDQARYLVACNFDQAEALMAAAGQSGVPVACVGSFGGTKVQFGRSQAELAKLSKIFRSSFASAVT